jgi:anti-sigma regulatory factor (Ser/Thr protein kinase)
MRFDCRRWELLECPPQLPVGIMPGFSYQHSEFELKPGHLWLLFSDGITEARNPTGEEYGEERLHKACPTCANAKRALDLISSDWLTFMGEQPQHDDASLLLLDWRGSAPAESLHIDCSTDNLSTAREYIESWAKFCGYDDITVGQIVLACDEATTNVYRHAYDGKGGSLEFQVNIIEDRLKIVLIDQGTPVELSKIKGRELDDLRPGGLGTVLLKQVFSEVTYLPQKMGTQLVLEKELPA